MKSRYTWMLGLLALAGCNTDSILYEPRQTALTWCNNQPCMSVHLGPLDFILSQPTSSLLVYLLAAQTIWTGFYLVRKAQGQSAMTWWGIEMLLGGVAAVLAGTSYQALGYELKCAGREACIWTNWLEITYNTLTVASIDAMAIAVAYSSTTGRFRKGIFTYAVINAVAHVAITLYGVFVANKFLISFEFLVLFCSPSFLLFIGLNSWRYARHRTTLDLVLLSIWIFLFAVIGVYFYYMLQGFTQTLWARGIWFSENDVLHVGMVLWIAYVPWILPKHLKDARAS